MSEALYILVVDNDRNMAKTLSDILRGKGYTPLLAGTGKVALNIVEKDTPAVALIDLKLEDMTGTELLKKIKECCPDTECIVLTWHASQASVIEAINLDVYGYIQKPYDVEQLLVAIRRAIEKQEAERALRESEERFRTLVEHAPDGILVFDTDLNKFIQANNKVLDLLGYTREELLNKHWLSISSPKQPGGRSSAEWGPELEAETLAGSVSINEWIFVTADGQEILTELRLTCLPASDRNLIRASLIDINERKQAEEAVQDSIKNLKIAYEQASIYAEELTRDITERKRTEKALRESEKRYKQLLGSVTDYIYTVEVEQGQPVATTHGLGCVAVTGYTPQEYEADPFLWFQMIYQEDRAMVMEQTDWLLAGEDMPPFEHRLAHKDGSIRWVRHTPVLRKDEQGGVIAYEGLISDITERRQAEEEIRKLNEELEQRVIDRTRELSVLYEVTMVASESLDLDKTLERSLDRVLVAIKRDVGAIHLLDETDGTLGGEALRLAVQQGTLPPEIDPLNNELASWIIERGEPLLIPDVMADPRMPQAVRTIGLRVYLGVPMRARGRVLGVLSVLGERQFNAEEVALLASVADQVGVAVESARLRQQAKQAAVMAERARLARELHDSVTQLLYSLTLLTGAGQRFARSGNLENIETYLADLGEIGQQALKEMRLLVYELRPATLEQEGLVGALQQRLDAVEGRAGVEAHLLVEKVDELPALVEEGFYRIAQEALNNALKHATATSVTVRIHADSEQVTLEVIDNGQGFDPNAVSDTGGLGLVSMRERAERLGGVLTLLSAPGQGTTVKVEISTRPLAVTGS